MLKIDNIDLVKKPYPHAVISDILDRSVYDQLLSEFPTDEEISQWQVVMGGRHRLTSFEIGFKQFLESRETWRSLYNYLNSPTFVKKLIFLYREALDHYSCQVDLERWKLDENFCDRQSRSMVASKDVKGQPE